MAVHVPAGLFLSAQDAALLDGVFRGAVVELGRRNGAVPAQLVHLSEDVHRLAAAFRAEVLARQGSGTGDDLSGSVAPLSAATDQPLSAAQVARLAGCSEEFVRRQARQGALKGAKFGPRGAWKLDPTSAALWMARRNRTSSTAA